MISLVNSLLIRLEKMAYTLESDLNLIFFGQLQDNQIIYINNKNEIILISDEKTVTYIK